MNEDEFKSREIRDKARERLMMAPVERTANGTFSFKCHFGCGRESDFLYVKNDVIYPLCAVCHYKHIFSKEEKS